MAGENAFYRIGDLDPDLMRFLNDIENEFPKTGAYEIDIEIYRNLGVLYLDIIPGLTSRYERGEISINEAYKIIDDKKERTREMIPTDAPFMVKLKIEDVLDGTCEKTKKTLDQIRANKLREEFLAYT